MDRAQTFVDSSGLSKNVTPFSVDARNGKRIKQFVSEMIKLRGIPDGLVNLIYASTAQKFEDLSEAEFDEVNHGGLTSTFLPAREVGVEMAARKHGSLVLFSSMYGAVSPDPKMCEAPMKKNPIEDGVTKAGIVQMTRCMAAHWGRENARCNCISPGPFPNSTVQKQNFQFTQKRAEKTAMGRIGKSEEIAGTVVFLLSDASSYITGQNWFVDGAREALHRVETEQAP